MQARVRCRWRRKQRKHRSIREARCFHYSATSDTPSPTHLALWQIFHALCVLALTRFLSPSVRWNISLSAGLRNSPFEKLPCETGSTYVYDIWYYTMMYIYVIYNYIIYNFLLIICISIEQNVPKLHNDRDWLRQGIKFGRTKNSKIA